jgi:hypothetical protein
VLRDDDDLTILLDVERVLLLDAPPTGDARRAEETDDPTADDGGG